MLIRCPCKMLPFKIPQYCPDSGAPHRSEEPVGGFCTVSTFSAAVPRFFGDNRYADDPLSAVLVLVFLVITEVGWNNNLPGVTVSGVGTQAGVVLLRQYLITIPDELLVVARTGGACEIGLFPLTIYAAKAKIYSILLLDSLSTEAP